MMLAMAKALRAEVVSNMNNDLSIMFVFFDGEEAIQQWTSSDSIYGARHLAKKWAKENFLPRIDMLVLLDLIGASNPKFYNYFDVTQLWFARLIGTELKLGENALLSSDWQKSKYFQPYSMPSFIEDDHIPFLRRDVPIMHCITYPFPSVWHRPEDDATAIDYEATYDLTKIFAVFAAEYLHLQGKGIAASNSAVSY